MGGNEFLDFIIAELRARGLLSSDRPNRRGDYKARCPFPGHEDRTPSFHVGPRGYRCFGCDRKGGLRSLARELGLRVDRPVSSGYSLEEFAADKRLPVGFLKHEGLQDGRWRGKAAVAMSYRDEAGHTIAARYRIARSGDRFR